MCHRLFVLHLLLQLPELFQRLLSFGRIMLELQQQLSDMPIQLDDLHQLQERLLPQLPDMLQRLEFRNGILRPDYLGRYRHRYTSVSEGLLPWCLQTETSLPGSWPLCSAGHAASGCVP